MISVGVTSCHFVCSGSAECVHIIEKQLMENLRHHVGIYISKETPMLFDLRNIFIRTPSTNTSSAHPPEILHRVRVLGWGGDLNEVPYSSGRISG